MNTPVTVQSGANISETGIRYGYIAAANLEPELVDALMYVYGKDEAYAEALKEAQAKHDADQEEAHEAWKEACDDAASLAAETGTDYIPPLAPNEEPFDEQAFADSYQCDEPIINGEHEGVTYRSSWLGGALNFFILKSPFTSTYRLCSPCVPNAGNLDQPDEDSKAIAYTVPGAWLAEGALIDFLSSRGVTVKEINCNDPSFPVGHFFYWVKEDQPAGPFSDNFNTWEEAALDFYAKTVQHV